MSKTVDLHLRSYVLDSNAQGWTTWRQVLVERAVPAQRTALVICDMWDQHWSRGAVERVNGMIPRMEAVVSAARNRGIHVIHAPSETMDFYVDHPARQRIQALSPVTPPANRELPDPAPPIADADGGSDTGESEMAQVWTRQHPGLTIDPARDVISDNGDEVYSYLHHHTIEQVLILGVHTNICILRRSFAIKQMVRWGQAIALVRDLTDTMYNPARPPYVSHDAGTQLVIGYIERFWCPTIASQDILAS